MILCINTTTNPAITYTNKVLILSVHFWKWRVRTSITLHTTMPPPSVLPAQMRYTFLLSWYQICSSPAASSLLPHDTVPRATKICVKPFWLSTLPHSAILFNGSSPHPQALILLKIAPAARTYGLHLCSEACFISLVFRILFSLSLKRASSIYMLRSCFIKRPGIKYVKH